MMIEELEITRQGIQAQLDKLKSQKDRNMMGQFSTPNALAIDILSHAKNLIPSEEKVRFLDPAIGTGSFYSALRAVFPSRQIEAATGFEIDEHYGAPSSELWQTFELNYLMGDFLEQSPPEENDKFNLIICNPPYVRHHHINGRKEWLKRKAQEVSGMKLSGLAGLYCYFMAFSHQWLKKNGIAGWLIPSEFMDVNYGNAVKDYLINEVSLLHVHRFDPNDVQFDDALVSSAVVWFKNKKPDRYHDVKFTYGGSLDKPSVEKSISLSSLRVEKKWSRFPVQEERNPTQTTKLGDYFNVKRGIATGSNKFFILSADEIKERGLPIEYFRPVLPSPRYLETADIKSDEKGVPKIKHQLFVLDCKLPLEEVKCLYPELYNYLQEGIKSGVSDGYICRNRKLWYLQENRPSSAFYCTYVGRTDKEGKKPFRFILNSSNAIVTNSYLILYPKPQIQKEIERNPHLRLTIIRVLSEISTEALVGEGRVYGGGMHKMEPRELSNVPLPSMDELFEQAKIERQPDMFLT